MKKLLIGLLALGSISSFASASFTIAGNDVSEIRGTCHPKAGGIIEIVTDSGKELKAYATGDMCKIERKQDDILGYTFSSVNNHLDKVEGLQLVAIKYKKRNKIRTFADESMLDVENIDLNVKLIREMSDI
ncbi:MAG: hypothetical protein N4A33_13510 [Bacteriovoracaceae bacterium]|jgi:hypothetical protein|nr:hypothetical protein [Bacteriovoracaceae bacterium]